MLTRAIHPLLSIGLSGAEAVEPGLSRKAGSAEMISLTKGLAAGDEEAFRKFHELYFDRLYGFLLVIARGQEHEAEEALQETMLRVAKYARLFESEEVFWSWLKTVARSAARDAGRKQSRYLKLLQKFFLSESTAVGNSVDQTEERLQDVLEESLAELEPGERHLLESKYVDDRSVRELAEASATTEKALESKLLRLRRQLRQNILKKLRDL